MNMKYDSFTGITITWIISLQRLLDCMAPNNFFYSASLSGLEWPPSSWSMSVDVLKCPFIHYLRRSLLVESVNIESTDLFSTKWRDSFDAKRMEGKEGNRNWNYLEWKNIVRDANEKFKFSGKDRSKKTWRLATMEPWLLDKSARAN